MSTIDILKKHAKALHALNSVDATWCIVEKDFPQVASEIEAEMYENMQYYMEYCRTEGYVTPSDWIKNCKHF
jgi:hypothetical protein